MSNKVYDILKQVSLMIVPIVAFLTALSEIWGWGDYGAEICATISAFGVLLGALLNVSTAQYNKIQESPEWEDAKGEDHE